MNKPLLVQYGMQSIKDKVLGDISSLGNPSADWIEDAGRAVNDIAFSVNAPSEGLKENWAQISWAQHCYKKAGRVFPVQMK